MNNFFFLCFHHVHHREVLIPIDWNAANSFAFQSYAPQTMVPWVENYIFYIKDQEEAKRLFVFLIHVKSELVWHLFTYLILKWFFIRNAKC